MPEGDGADVADTDGELDGEAAFPDPACGISRAQPTTASPTTTAQTATLRHVARCCSGLMTAVFQAPSPDGRAPGSQGTSAPARRSRCRLLVGVHYSG